MSKINIPNTKKLLSDFAFGKLFIEELGWNNPSRRNPVAYQGGQAQPIAEVGGVLVLEIVSDKIPTAQERKAVHDKIRPTVAEHILIFRDQDKTLSCWSWVKVEDKKKHYRDHYYVRGQAADGFISKIAAMAVDFEELDAQGTLGLVAANKKLKDALDIQRVVRRFYDNFKTAKDDFTELIQGIPDTPDRNWYANVVLNRLMFIYFMQKGRFIDGGNLNYLEEKLAKHQEDFYPVFLQNLFFEAFAKPNPSAEAKAMCGNIKYLNGGLFMPHTLEDTYGNKIKIPAKAFQNVFKLFGSYSWTFSDLPDNPGDDLNPEVLGYIFEKYINQKEFGAYYTPSEITDYLCEQTINQLVLNKLREQKIPVSDSIGDTLMRLDEKGLHFVLHQVLRSLSVLDPACGSGAFLFAALKAILRIYETILGRVDTSTDDAILLWKKNTFSGHPSIGYTLRKMIITNNLYGVDIMAEATEIARLRLFMALVSSVKTVDELEPLPNIDFNILPGNSLIGLMRVEDEAFDKDKKKTSSLFGAATDYQDLVTKRNNLTHEYRHPSAARSPLEVRHEIKALDEKAMPRLHAMMLENFHNLKVLFEQATWDSKAKKQGKPEKSGISAGHIHTLSPFHWGYQFNVSFQKAGGFDAIITNPPWEVLKPQDKEFFEKHSDVVTKNKMTIKEFEKEKDTILKENEEVREAYLAYLSQFPHQSQYFRSAPEYANQSAIVNNKRTGTDINLYKLFTERCFQLLRPGGLCGIVIPSGIYTDLGAKGLRQMLFEKTSVTGLFGFENRKAIFEGVDSRFKFVVLSFRKGGTTESFPAVFMRHETSDLQDFPRSLGLMLKVSDIKRFSPDSWSLMEFKEEMDFRIAEKMLKFPLLGEKIEGTWNLKLTREFDMTNDSHLFQTSPGPGRLPLFEGKHIWQFDSNYLERRYWVDERQGRKNLLGRTEDNGQDLDYRFFRLGFRDIASNTNERTLVSTIIPPAFHGNKLPTVVVIGDDQDGLLPDNPDLVVLCALWNSFCLDWVIRQKVTTTLNFHYLYSLPVPRLHPRDQEFAPIAARSARLICTTPEFAELWHEVMADRNLLAAAQKANPEGNPITAKWTPACGATNPSARAKLRAELDGLIAHLYGLTEEEFAHILSTFPLVQEPVIRAARAAYRDVVHGVIQ